MTVYQDLSGRKLGKKEFITFLEKKVANVISKYKLIQRGDVIGVALSGGKDSLVLLHVLAKMQKKGGFTLKAVLVNEGIKGYREKTIKPAEDCCKEHDVELHKISYEELFGQGLDSMVKQGHHPCSICGVFRRKLLNKKARELGCTKLATGHNLDDEAQSVLMNLFKNNQRLSARMGPITGLSDHDGFIPRIKPLYMCTEKEIMLYAFLHGLTEEFLECPYVTQSFRREVQTMLNELEDKYPGTKQGLIHAFLEQLPSLKEHYTTETPLQKCKECGEPCSGEVCNACKMEEKLAEGKMSL